MKQIAIVLLAGLALTLSACSSKDKTAENTAPTNQATVAKTESPAATETKKTALPTKARAAVLKSETTMNSNASTSATGSVADMVTCTSGSDSRTLEIKGLNSGCEVVYTKQNQPSTIATAANDKSYCEGVSAKVKANLEGAGYKCE